MINAFWRMNYCQNNLYVNSYAYTQSRNEYVKSISGKNHFMFGKNLSEEHKRKISESHFGLKHSEETKQKIRKNHADMSGENNPFYGKKHTEETRKKIRKALSGEKHPRAKKVLCIETNIVYLTIADAIKKTGIKHICDCCKGRLKQAGGYHWKYVDEVNDEEK